MAPMEDSIYFPSLDKCLYGNVQLISWQLTYIGLSQIHVVGDKGALRKHLTDPRAIEILSRITNTFPKATKLSQAAFETLTSAINVTPTTNGRFDIKQIKEDALWLSKEAGIDEVSALRIVVLMWQARPATRLLHEIPGSDAIGRNAAPSKSALFHSVFKTTISPVSKDTAPFDAPRTRHVRLLELYLVERQFLSKVIEYITFAALAIAKPSGPAWIKDVAIQIVESWKSVDGASSLNKEYFTNVLASLERNLRNIESGSGWIRDEGVHDGLEVLWRKTSTLEIIHKMQTLLFVVNFSQKLPSSSVLLCWYNFMAKYQFFEQLPLLVSELSEIYGFSVQSLAALISLAILKVPLALDALNDMASQMNTGMGSLGEHSFLEHSQCVETITQIFLDAAHAPFSVAGPCMFAWGIIMQSLRSYAGDSQEFRETRQSQRAIDNFASSQQLDNESREPGHRQSRSSNQRRSSFSSDGSQQGSYLEGIADAIQKLAPNDDPINLLVRVAVDQLRTFDLISKLAADFCTPFGSENDGQRGLEMRTVLLDLMSAALIWLDYQPEVMETILSILDGNQLDTSHTLPSLMSRQHEPTHRFWNDSRLRIRIFNVALSRYPYESVPFLALCRLLVSSQAKAVRYSVASVLRSVDTMTTMLTERDADWRLGNGDDTNYLELTTPLDVFAQFLRREQAVTKTIQAQKFTASRGPVTSLHIPRGTHGKALTEGKPLVVAWQFKYSAFYSMGLFVQYALANWSTGSSSDGETMSDIISEIIGLITAMFSSSVDKESDKPFISHEAEEQALAILEEVSEGLDDNKDIITLIFDVFEDELHREQLKGSSNTLLVRCMEFTRTMLYILPGRVWTFLGKSGLLGLNDNESRLSTVIASAEIPAGRYSFLISSIGVLEILSKDALAHTILRRSSSNAAVRFGSLADTGGTGVSGDLQKKIFLRFHRVMVDIFESTRNWRFALVEERTEIHARICNLFLRTLSFSFDVDDNADLTQKQTGFFAPTATYLLDVFLSKSLNNAAVQALVQILYDGIHSQIPALSIISCRFIIPQTVNALRLSTKLVRLSRDRNQTPTWLEQQLFDATPVLAKLYATHMAYRMPINRLLDALVRAAGTSSVQPPSLLGHLGQDTAKSFIDMLSQLDQPLGDQCMSVSIWSMLSAVISQRQQWFTIYLLTGSTPRENLKDRDRSESSNTHIRPVLDLALSQLSNINMLGPEEAIHVLEFVALAADFWPWVSVLLGKDKTLMSSLIQFLSNLDLTSNAKDEKLDGLTALRLQIGAYIAEILAMQVHHGYETGNPEFAIQLIPHLDKLFKHAGSAPSYNTSLHGNLRNNFKLRYPNCSLLNFKRTTVNPSELGPTFYYDLEVAHVMLGFDSAWNVNGTQGFSSEFTRANINLSLVQSQVALFRSWKSLLIELSLALGEDSAFQKSLVGVIRDYLQANQGNALPEHIFNDLAQSRADLAFTLLQSIVEVSRYSTDAKALLRFAWDALRDRVTDLGLSLTSADAEYCRTLLRILYLALQPHTQRSSGTDNETASIVQTTSKCSDINSVVVGILELVASRGFRSLTALLHENPEKILPSDFALINAILRSALHVPGIELNVEQLLNSFGDDRTEQYATTLLSWADKLAIGGDPIYGEISLTFLLEISTLPALAESIVLSGCLGQISAANLMNYLRRPEGIGPFDEPARMYGIWTRGILPLIINLLSAIGAPIASDVAAFINQFAGQLNRASSGLDTKPSTTSRNTHTGYITLSMASEAHSLALLSCILDIFRDAGASAGIVAANVEELAWDQAQVKEDLESRLQRRNGLRESIVATDEKEEAWSRQKPMDAQFGAESLLEEKVVEQLSAALAMLGDGET